jgi:hypothetical protein
MHRGFLKKSVDKVKNLLCLHSEPFTIERFFFIFDSIANTM